MFRDFQCPDETDHNEATDGPFTAEWYAGYIRRYTHMGRDSMVSGSFGGPCELRAISLLFSDILFLVYDVDPTANKSQSPLLPVRESLAVLNGKNVTDIRDGDHNLSVHELTVTESNDGGVTSNHRLCGRIVRILRNEAHYLQLVPDNTLNDQQPRAAGPGTGQVFASMSAYEAFMDETTDLEGWTLLRNTTPAQQATPSTGGATGSGNVGANTAGTTPQVASPPSGVEAGMAFLEAAGILDSDDKRRLARQMLESGHSASQVTDALTEQVTVSGNSGGSPRTAGANIAPSTPQPATQTFTPTSVSSAVVQAGMDQLEAMRILNPENRQNARTMLEQGVDIQHIVAAMMPPSTRADEESQLQSATAGQEHGPVSTPRTRRAAQAARTIQATAPVASADGLPGGRSHSRDAAVPSPPHGANASIVADDVPQTPFVGVSTARPRTVAQIQAHTAPGLQPQSDDGARGGGSHSSASTISTDDADDGGSNTVSNQSISTRFMAPQRAASGDVPGGESPSNTISVGSSSSVCVECGCLR